MTNMWLGILLSLVVSQPAKADSAIGNGGDVFTRYLEATRYALVESLQRLQKGPTDHLGLCNPSDQPELNEAQRDECREFFSQSLITTLIKLNSFEKPTPFVLKDEPLRVRGIDGVLREVDAVTELGPDGPIWFSYHRVKFHSPRDLLTLFVHEFGHKAAWIEDNLPTRAFPQGRHLLDAIGFALAKYAERQGLIGGGFTLLDHFSCQITYVPFGFSTRSSCVEARRFSERDPDRYLTGIGIGPMCSEMSALISPTLQLHLRVEVTERSGCEKERTEGRRTEIQLTRVHVPEPGQIAPPDELVLEKNLEGWNPLCSKERETFGLEFQGWKFECAYSASQALNY